MDDPGGASFLGRFLCTSARPDITLAGQQHHRPGGNMEHLTASWPPSEGDTARVKADGLVGTVIQTKGVYEARFRLKIPPPTEGGDTIALKSAKAAARRASRWYGLDELEPPG
jgi:hypothetical protein